MFPQEFNVPLFAIELSGYLAAALVFLTFYMKTMLPLRYIAIGSNVLFIVYAALEQINPVLILHCVLLPLNIYRVVQLKKLISNVTAAATGDFSIDWLLPYMNRRRMPAGEYLFRRGEIADDMFYIVRGQITLPEVEVQRSAGQMIGEIGLFSPQRQRIASARCETDCELLTITGTKVLDLYYQNPDFGIYLVRLITGRLIREVDRLQRNDQPTVSSNTGPASSPPMTK